MPPRRAPTARSSSRSSKRDDLPLPRGSAAAHPAGVAVGEIVGAHGLRGLLRVRAYQPPAPSLAADRDVLLEQDGAWREARVSSAALHGRGIVLLGLEGLTDRTAAEALVGARVLVRRADLPPAAPGEFYYHELEGFHVVTSG